MTHHELTRAHRASSSDALHRTLAAPSLSATRSQQGSAPGQGAVAFPSSASLDIVLLRSFLEVVERGGFAVAAHALALTPSAVSGHIRRLEDAVGVRLLARTTRRQSVTQAGETLYLYARNIVALEREARARLLGARVQGRLRIGASEDFASAWLPQVLQTFRRWHPGTTIELKVGITGDLLSHQARGRLDVVFGKRCRGAGGEGELLWEEPLIWVYTAAAALPEADCVDLALFPEPCVYREAAITALAQAGRAWNLVFESSSMAGCRAAALSGLAVTVLARSQLGSGLREVGPAHGLPRLPAAQFYAFATTGSQAGRALVQAVRTGGLGKDVASAACLSRLSGSSGAEPGNP